MTARLAVSMKNLHNSCRTSIQSETRVKQSRIFAATAPLSPFRVRTMSQAAKPKAHNYKRLIVLCDGTWQDSNADKVEHPTNVTRFARALRARHASTEEDEAGRSIDREIPQIVFYQPGPGSTTETKYSGGLYGTGVSATVRAAYAFLAHNFDPGDDIFFFGFSRGAYIARSVAGLVTSLGLLTKKGMDQFPLVYDKYYEHAGHMSAEPNARSFEDSHPTFVTALEENGHLQTRARSAVKVIGVWDTVGFHTSGRGDEKIEFHNLTLSPLVPYAFHALALDETRWPFKPTLWVKPGAESLAKGKETLKKFGVAAFEQDMKQVWFSGYHSDIGGGLDDPRLSDIALGWMIAQCHKTGLLDFADLDSKGEERYLIDDEPGPVQTEKDTWRTSEGRANAPEGFKALMRRFLSKDREPLTITRPEDDQTIEINDGSTNEMVHASVRDRPFEDWKCPALTGERNADKTTWKIRGDRGLSLTVAPVEGDELFFKGRIRSVAIDQKLVEASEAKGDDLGEERGKVSKTSKF